MMAEGEKVNFKVDTGAEVTAISEKSYSAGSQERKVTPRKSEK